jgi:DNA primase
MSDSVQQIKERLNIIDVVSPYVELHKAGKNFKGKSPFAAEKTPSFYVSPDRGMYYCFSTSQGGDIFNFVQAMEGVDFKEALKVLAHKAGVELVPEDPKKKTERERQYAALTEAVTFYNEFLGRESEASAYLKERGVKDETIAKWNIGYAPGPPNHGWRVIKEHLQAKGFSSEELLKVGLVKIAADGKDPFDMFRDRIVFPMADPGGKYVAFSGRILHPNEKAPKYVNSPETELYKKSDLLYGYDKAKSGIRTLNFSLIVEGQFDVVMCHQAGYNNTVAVSGTALTVHHVQLLERMSEKVVLALDADRAGIAAMKKAADVMLRRGLDVKVAELPLGKDPADIILENPSDFKKFIGSSVHVIEFLLHVLRREITDERTFKLKAREDILPFILLLPSRIDQEHFVDKVAESIGTTADAIRYELERLREQAESTAKQSTAAQNREVLTTAAAQRPVSSDAPQKTYTYLVAAGKVIEAQMAKKLSLQLEELLKIVSLPTPEESDTAGVMFILEQEFSVIPAQAVVEEILAKLNQLKTSLVRKRLSEYRHALLEAERTGQDEEFVSTLENIKSFESKLREPAFIPSDLTE